MPKKSIKNPFFIEVSLFFIGISIVLSTITHIVGDYYYSPLYTVLLPGIYGQILAVIFYKISNVIFPELFHLGFRKNRDTNLQFRFSNDEKRTFKDKLATDEPKDLSRNLSDSYKQDENKALSLKKTLPDKVSKKPLVDNSEANAKSGQKIAMVKNTHKDSKVDIVKKQPVQKIVRVVRKMIHGDE